MKKFLLFFLVFTFLYADDTKDVLLIHSYHKGFSWSDEISKQVEENFSQYPNIELTTIYMDTKRVDSKDYIQSLTNLYKKQFLKRKFRLIIASDNNALDFAMKNHNYLFKNTPIIFCGINNFKKESIDKLGLSKLVTGIVEEVDLETNFKLISKLHPNLEKLIIINDTSKTGLAIKNALKPIIKEYKKKFDIEYTDNLKIEKLKEKISTLEKEKSAILTVLLFKDATGKFLTYKQTFKKIKQASKVPIYGLWDFYLKKGIVGGLLTSAKMQGQAVSKMALEVLEGKKISDIPIIEQSPNSYIFDYNELEKFNIDVKSYIDNPIIVNEHISFYKKYSKILLISTTIITFLCIIVLILKVNIQRRQKLEEELSNRIEFDKVLLDTIPNPIYYTNIHGKFLGCNLAFCNLIGERKNFIIGKTIYDFFPKKIAKKNNELDKELLKTLGTCKSDLTFYPTKNKMKHIIFNKAVYKNTDNTVGGIVCIMNDVTQRVQQKQFLIQQSKLAEMGDMIAAIAHQWNEPLVELSALVQDIQTSYLLKELKDVDVKNFVNDSMVQIKYMSRTLSDFRNFLKPSTKKKLFSISKSLSEINEIIGKQIFYSNIYLKFNYTNTNEELLIYGYENEFKQVLLNLINNAKDKIIEKNINTYKKGNITINIKRTADFNIIEIVDDAGAIDKRVIDSIFEPYFSTKQNGMGIGLYMAKVIIEDKMQGKLSVKNDKDNVIFTIKLPHKV